MKILIVDDEKTTRMTMQRLLETRGYDVLTAENGREGWELFQREKGDIRIALLDWMMPEMDGLELCRRIKETELSHYVYIMFLTGKKDMGSLVEAFEKGADDYLTKPFNKGELLARAKVGMRMTELHQELKDANEKFYLLSITDGLTGILNRRALLDRLEAELSRATREKIALCLIMLDVDHFKDVNDLHGHIVGDRVLVEVVNRIKSSLRSYDVIGRYGGEEFLIGAPISEPQAGEMIAERVRMRVSKQSFDIDGKKLNITISLGVTTILPSGETEDTSTLEPAIKEADSALYRAKDKGRNRVVVYDGAMG